jgi:hypothetical protein
MQLIQQLRYQLSQQSIAKSSLQQLMSRIYGICMHNSNEANEKDQLLQELLYQYYGQLVDDAPLSVKMQQQLEKVIPEQNWRQDEKEIGIIIFSSLISLISHKEKTFQRDASVMLLRQAIEQLIELESNTPIQEFILAHLINDWSKISFYLHLFGYQSIPIYSALCRRIRTSNPIFATFLSPVMDWNYLFSFLLSSYHDSNNGQDDSGDYVVDTIEFQFVHSFINECSQRIHDQQSTVVGQSDDTETLQKKFEHCLDLINSIHTLYPLYQCQIEIHLVKAQLHLLYAKILLICYQNHQGAHSLIKYALHYVIKQSRIECLMIQCELLMLLVEIYDFIGRISRALDYLAEIEYHCQQLHSMYYKNILSLHMIRVLYRAGSSRCVELIQNMLQTTNEDDEVHDMVAYIANVMKMSDILGDMTMPSSIPRFRALRKLWNLPSSYPASSYAHHVLTPSQLKSYSMKNSAHIVEILSCQRRLSFDQLRTIRRQLCIANIHHPIQSALLTYLLGIASCSCTIEIQHLSPDSSVRLF